MAQILIPTDMSEGSRTAVLFALNTFDTEKDQFTLLLSIGDTPRPRLFPEFIQYVKQQAREELDAFVARIRNAHPGKTLNLRGVVENGSVFAVIEGHGRNNPVDMVVMGTRGEGGALKWGSNAEVVARNASGPVIVVPPEWEAGPIEKILYADDREEVDDLKTLLPLVQLAKHHGAGIDFVHVSKEGVVREPEPGSAGRSDIFQGIKTSNATTMGASVTENLARLVDGGGYGMLAIMHRRLGWLDALFHRSVAKRMALNTTVPLLVLHE
jgi:nucleotide-binding universal stress UspA family protein